MNSCTGWVPETRVHIVKPRRNWIMHRSLLLCVEENRKKMGHWEVFLRCFSKGWLTCFYSSSLLRVEATDLVWPLGSSNSGLISHSSLTCLHSSHTSLFLTIKCQSHTPTSGSLQLLHPLSFSQTMQYTYFKLLYL